MDQHKEKGGQWGRSGEDVLPGRWGVLGFFGNKKEAVWLEVEDSGG